MKILTASVALSLPLLTMLPAARAADYQGAEAVLKLAGTAAADADGTKGASGELSQWHADLKTYHERAATLPPDESARDWLALFDRALKLPDSPQERSSGSPVSMRLLEVFQVLPAPAAWDGLATQAAARPLPKPGSTDFATSALRIITANLQGNADLARRDIQALAQSVNGTDDARRNGLRDAVQTLETAFYVQTGDKASLLAGFEAKLALFEPGGDAALSSDERASLRTEGLDVPDLVALTDPTRAEALLKRLFAIDAQSATFHGERTKALARKVAAGMGDHLKLPVWSLADTLDSTALYELLEKRFPDKNQNNGNRHEIDVYYLLGLIAAGRYDDATAMTLKMPEYTPHEQQSDTLGDLSDTVMTDLASKGYAKEVFRFFDRLLASRPALPYWESYTTAAVLAGETDAMLARVKAASENPDLKPTVKAELREVYGKALLAADHVAEALPLLREQAAVMIRSALEKADPHSDSRALDEGMEAAAALAVVGQLLGDPALVNEQLDAIVKAASNHPLAIASVSGPSSESLTEIFLAAGRGPELERLYADNLAEIERADARRQPDAMLVPDVESNSVLTPLVTLTDLYYQAGRYEDIVALLDHAKGWGEADLAKLVGSRSNFTGSKFGYQAARALQKTGHADAALRVVNAFLENNGGSDPAYALLLELLPPDRAEARLDELFARDQFEERPLIWRAFLQLGQGRLDDAEKSARQAISIDPSDGEEGRGDRMRAYAVLADILERKGDGEKPGQMRKAVQAIRLSEDADRFHGAGLLTRAVGMYEKALGYFSDAYCIQSRLAIQLNALGKFDEAAAHYERAYELMPESFGRMESHCFGCERAFAGQRAQSLAERVFRQLAAKQPDNARVHYLLGYLRNEQERTTEAAEEFREAVRLDPDYINAWKQLAATTDRPADTDRAELNLLRLDPQRKHDSADLTAVGDLKALWHAAEAAEKLTPRDASELYPLAASKAALEQAHRQRAKRPDGADEPADPADPNSGLQGLFGFRGDEQLVPWVVVLKNRVITETLPFLRKDAAGNDASD